jgi:arylsulfatase A-like enzyme/uncharacterized membrane protein YbhN (UPF0104 family)
MSSDVSWLRHHWKKVLVFLLKVVFITSLFVLLLRPETFGFRPDLFKNITLQGLLDDLKSIEFGNAALWFGFAVAVKLGGILAGVIRWRILLRAQGVHIPFWYLTKCWFWGRAIGLFLPGTLGLDGYRLVESARHTGEPIKCATVIAVEKLTGIIALFSLVFLTLPLGLRLFDINLVLLGIVLLVLAGFIGASLLLLLQPRVIQIFIASLPVPGFIHEKINKLGVAATAYSAHRGALFKALFFGLCVHLGICLMYFGTASAIRAENTGILEILFASPLLIVGSVFAPTVSGVGVREVVMTTLLGGVAGGSQALLFGHLGLWFGEVVPFVLSIPLLLLTGRPNRDDLMEEIAEVREKIGTGEESKLHLTREELAFYRAKVFGVLTAGTIAGLAAGGLLGLLEAGWIHNTLGGFSETGVFTWGVLAYGLIFGAVGKGVAFGLLFIYLLLNRFAAPWWNCALSFAGTFLAGGLVIGLFRLRRDVYDGHMPDSGGLLQLGLTVGGIALVGGLLFLVIGRLVGRSVPGRPGVLIAGGLLTYGVFLVAGAALGAIRQPEPPIPVEMPENTASGPNLILIAVDTLRADYLPAYNDEIETRTPNFDAFFSDAVRYEHGFSQASWTKASFGSIFSGMYPECHTAVTKTASLPEDVETVAELLQDGGYHTQGFANNPNITSVFGYDQGFREYVDLKKSLHFGASPSAAQLSMYEVLLKVREVVNKRLGRSIQVTDYYQPASAVKDTILAWLDSGQVPDGAPFFLFTHFMDPHDPFMSPEAPDGGYGRKRLGNPDPAEHLDGMRRAYIGEIEYLDAELGKFFDGLKTRGLYDDALIVLTADHGEEFQEHGGWWHGQTLFDEQTHVPFVIKLPSNAQGGEVNIDLARNLDIAPTLLHFAGLEKGSMMQGQSLFDATANPTNGDIGYSYAENNFEGIVLQALRTGTHKLIRANEDNKRGLPGMALYNVTDDPGEQKNLAEEEAEADIKTQLDSGISGYLKICEENAVEPAAPVSMDAETLRQMDAIGYLE